MLRLVHMADARSKGDRIAGEQPDRQLLERACDGDREALRAFYARHSRYVAGVVFRILGTDQELEDVVQETFLEALAGLHKVRDPARVRSWLASIAVRRVYRLLSRRTRRRQLADGVRETACLGLEPEDREFALTLYRALDEAEARDRIAWVLHRIEGETLPDTARILGVSLATVKRRVARVDGLVRRRLGHER